MSMKQFNKKDFKTMHKITGALIEAIEDAKSTNQLISVLAKAQHLIIQHTFNVVDKEDE